MNAAARRVQRAAAASQRGGRPGRSLAAPLTYTYIPTSFKCITRKVPLPATFNEKKR